MSTQVISQVQEPNTTKDVEATKQGSNRKRKAKRDPNRPKKARSAYILYSKAHRDDVVKEMGEGADFVEISKKLGSIWKALPEEEQSIWKEKAAKDKERFEEEMRDYVPPEPTPPKTKSIKIEYTDGDDKLASCRLVTSAGGYFTGMGSLLLSMMYFGGVEQNAVEWKKIKAHTSKTTMDSLNKLIHAGIVKKVNEDETKKGKFEVSFTEDWDPSVLFLDEDVKETFEQNRDVFYEMLAQEELCRFSGEGSYNLFLSILNKCCDNKA